MAFPKQASRIRQCRSGGPPRRETTAQLLVRVRKGDDAAREDLIRRHLAPLRRFAHGRLPSRARDIHDTGDLVQNTIVRALKRIEGFQSKHEGAFFAYLRCILKNLVRDEARRVSRKPETVPLDEQVPGRMPSPLEQAIGAENMEIYERALECLSEMHRQATILRLEFGFSYAEIAAMLERPSPSAARMLTSRATLRLAEQMRRLGEGS